MFLKSWIILHSASKISFSGSVTESTLTKNSLQAQTAQTYMELFSHIDFTDWYNNLHLIHLLVISLA